MLYKPLQSIINCNDFKNYYKNKNNGFFRNDLKLLEMIVLNRYKKIFFVLVGFSILGN